MAHKRWTKKEVEYLKNNIKETDISEIANTLNRSVEAVETKLYRLGLLNIKYRRWTKEEEDYLERNVGKKSIPTIAKKLKRSEEAVEAKMYRLGLSDTKLNTGMLTANALANELHIDAKTVTWLIERHGLPAKKRATRKTREYYFIDVKEFWKWADQNRRLIDFRKIEPLSLAPEPDWVEEERINPTKQELWTEERVRKLIQLVRNNVPHKEIAEVLGLELHQVRTKIYYMRSRNKLEQETIGIPWRQEEIDIMYELEKKGYSDGEIAYELGRERKHVTNKRFQLRQEGIYEGTRNNRTWTKKEIELLQKLDEEKVPIKEIAEQLGRGLSGVYRKRWEIRKEEALL